MLSFLASGVGGADRKGVWEWEKLRSWGAVGRRAWGNRKAQGGHEGILQSPDQPHSAEALVRG